MATKTEPSRETLSVGLPGEIVRKLRLIAAHRSLSMADILLPIIGEKIEREYRKVVTEVTELGDSGA